MKKSCAKAISVLIAAITVLASVPLSGFIGLQLAPLSFAEQTQAQPEALSGECGKELVWSFDSEYGILSINGVGEMTNWSRASAVPWSNHAASVQAVIINDGVTSIGNNAFSACKALTSLNIASSVTAIGKNAFSACKALKQIDLSSCMGLTSIADEAFADCSAATAAVLPLSLTSLGEAVFDGCSKMSAIYFDCDVPEGLLGALPKNSSKLTLYFTDGKQGWTEPKWNDYNCWRNAVITADNTVLDSENKNAFGLLFTLDEESMTAMLGNNTSKSNNCAYGGSNLGYIDIPAEVIKDSVVYAVTAIGQYAFNGSNAKSINIPASVLSIGAFAFTGCKELSSISVDSANTRFLSIDGVLFNNAATQLIAYPAAKNDTEYTVDDEVTSILEDAFRDAANINTLTLPFVGGSKTENSTLSYIFGSVPSALKTVILSTVTELIPEKAFNGCSNITSIILPAGITEIQASAFSGCSKLTDIDLSYCIQLTSIRKSAFSNCKAVTEMDLSACSLLTKIEESAFSGCVSLGSITLPDSIKTIGKDAFKSCEALVALSFGKNVTSLPVSAFDGCEKLAVLYVDSENEKFYTDNAGALLNKTQTTLIYYPQGRTRPYYTVPSTVTAIGKDAFAPNSNLTNVYIPAEVTSIPDGNFEACPNLILLVYSNSAALTYAEENSLTYVNVDNATMTGIAVRGEPAAKEYVVDTEFIFDDLFIVSTYDTFEIQENDYELIYDNSILGNQDVIVMHTTPAGVQYTATFTIAVLREPPVSPEIVSVTDTSVTLTPVEGCEYSADGINWQSSEVFTELKDNTEYSFLARYPAMGEVAASACSAPVKATTTKHIWSGWSIKTEATCTQPGSQRRDCSNCGIYEIKVIPARGHSWGAWEDDTEATCTQSGATKRICLSCGDSETTEVPPLGHSWGAWKETTAATCKTAGVVSRVCSYCKETETDSIPTLEHTWGAWKTVTEATSKAEGSEQRTCSVCKQTEKRAIAKLEIKELEITASATVKPHSELYVFAACDTTAKALLDSATDTAEILTSDGKPVDAATALCSGMKIVLKVGNDIIDSRIIVVPADVDGDSVISAADARLALRLCVQLETLTDWQKAAANVDDDTDITSADARLILRASVGLETKASFLK